MTKAIKLKDIIADGRFIADQTGDNRPSDGRFIADQMGDNRPPDERFIKGMFSAIDGNEI